MKKISLLLAALALVLGTSQCSKENEPAQSGGRQHIVLNASFDDGNSKIADDNNGGLKWSVDDQIDVFQNNAKIGFLKCTDAESGTFEGDIEPTTGDAITFTFGTQDFDNQPGDLDAAIYLTSGEVAYVEGGNYGTVSMTMPHAVLKLDVSALGTSGAMTIAAGGATVASVTEVSGIANAVFVAVPANGESTEYTISCGGKTATENWPLEPNVFYTKDDGHGGGTGNAIVIEPDAPAHEYVDLGLSVKWATCNIGANSLEEYGDYYAWGETGTKTDYSWGNYNHGSGDIFTKYNTDSEYGTVDGKTVLEPGDDAAHANWGDGWRMPTTAEWQELYDNTTSTWTTLNGVNGRLFTSKVSGYTDVTLFLPAAGGRDGSSLDDAGSFGYYWSSSLYSGDPHYAYRMYFRSDYVGPQSNNYRYYGFPVRPVR